MKNLKNKNIMLIIIFYLALRIILSFNYNNIFFNYINPIFWIYMLIYMSFSIKNSYIKFNYNNKYLINMIIISSVHIIIYFYIGFISGFSINPYSHKFLSIIGNLIKYIIPVISIELARNVLAISNKNNKKILILLTILFVLIEVNYNSLTNLYKNKEELFKYICSTIIPLISCGILYTYLTLKGSYKLVLIYRLSNELTILLLPILPNIDWFLNCAIFILSPTLIYVLYKYKFDRNMKKYKNNFKIKMEKINYIIALTIFLFIVCFMYGIFKYKPITILSNSMFPTFSRGDIIIFKTLNNSELKNIEKKSIIIYKIGDKLIAHRVVDKIVENNAVFYKTKGDNNNTPDTNLVKINQIQGIYIFNIKFLGFPSVWLYDYFNYKKI